MNNNDNNNQNNGLFNINNLPDLGHTNNNLNGNNNINNNVNNVNNVNNFNNVNVPSNNQINNQDNVQEYNIYADQEEEEVPQETSSLTTMLKDDNNNTDVVNAPILDQKQSKSALLIVGVALIVLFLISGGIMFATDFFKDKLVSSPEKSQFIVDAKSILSQVLRNNSLENGLCTSAGSRKVLLNSMSFDEPIVTSPFGRNYDLGKSYVLIKYDYVNNKCLYEYYIYLTDGIMSIGSSIDPVNEDMMDVDNFRLTKE